MHFTFVSSALLPVLGRVSIATVKHYGQNNKLGRKVLFRFTLPHWCSPLKVVRTATQAGKEPGGGS